MDQEKYQIDVLSWNLGQYGTDTTIHCPYCSADFCIFHFFGKTPRLTLGSAPVIATHYLVRLPLFDQLRSPDNFEKKAETSIPLTLLN